MATQVSDIMTREVVTASVDLTIRELMGLLRQASISGVPVTDSELRLVGVISETDLIRLDVPEEDDGHDSISLSGGVMSVERSYTMEQLDATVGEVMVKKILTVEPTTTVKAACRLFADHRVHRLVVLDGGEIAGIITPVDVARALADGTLSVGD